MCGIVGYIGKKDAKEILIKGLKKLEYRGYDSAGIAFFKNQKVEMIKSVGKISKLEDKLQKGDFSNYNIGIAHTRWATHGKVTLENAHPHQVGEITLVHNGIIENIESLKNDLEKERATFYSQTDTEIVAYLLNKYLEPDFLKTIQKVTKLLKGSYALGIIVKSEDSTLYVVKKDSPVVIGLGEDENFFASDISAIHEYTNDFMFLDEEEIAKITKDSVEVYNKNLEMISKKVQTIQLEQESLGKQGFPHYMLKEIYEQPIVLEKTLNKYMDKFSELPDLTTYQEIHIVACGSAMYVGMIGKYLFEENASLKTIVTVASEYRYEKTIYNNETLVILVSQSGETADTIAALRKAKENGQTTLAIVNVKSSTIAKEADQVLFIEAGEEVAVATTKAYTLQVAMFALLSLKLAYDKKLIMDIDSYLKDFKEIPNLLKKVIEQEDDIKTLAIELAKSKDIFFIGRKIDYAICLEGSLKLKEISYIHSEAYQAGELKHGTISLIEKDTPVIAIITDREIAPKSISNVEEVESRGAKSIMITTEKLKELVDASLVVPSVCQFLQPLLVVPILQLLAYHVAVLKNCDIDKPRNLAKSVTVE